jgi:aryl-alcohol dehydrogenase-like predicted oxidoreductase
VSAIGLGCMGLSFGYGAAVDEQQGISLIRSAIERGVTSFDTTEVYARSRARSSSARPSHLSAAIATKFGFGIDQATRQQRGLNSRPGAYKAGRRSLTPAA